MATAGHPDEGQFGGYPGPNPPYPVYQPPKGNQVGPPGYPPPPPPYGAAPQAGFPENPSHTTINFSPAMSQQSTVVIGTPAPHYVTVGRTNHHSYAGHMVFACLVFWLCGWIFGLVAFILAGEH